METQGYSRGPDRLPPELEEALVNLIDLEGMSDAAMEEFCRRHAEHGDHIRAVWGHLCALSPPDRPSVTRLIRNDSHGSADVESSESVGKYFILEEIGRGGVGIVHRARDIDLDRDVAVKFLQSRYHDDRDIKQRFVEEARIGGRLQHPGVVPVYDMGSSDEAPYFAMKLIEGEELSHCLNSRESPSDDLQRVLAIFQQVCQAVGYAHSRQIVHRDLKPANILIGAFGEVQVVDWGMAKSIAEPTAEAPLALEPRPEGEDREVTEGGSIYGTPAYLSPEQARGRNDEIDTRTDVFALGATLCEILTGAAPYARSSISQSLRAARSVDLAPSHRRLADPSVDAELREICLACLEPEMADRPTDGSVVAERIGSYLASVEQRAQDARIQSAEARLRSRFVLRSAVVALILIAGAAASVVMWQNEAARIREQANLEVAQTMGEARQLGGAARERLGVDANDTEALAGFREAVRVVETALSHAGGAAASTKQEVESHLRSMRAELITLEATARRVDRDRRLTKALAAVRIPTGDDTIDELDEVQRLDVAYLAVFVTFGVDFASLSASEAERVLRGTTDEPIAFALDDWAHARRVIARNGAEARAPTILADKLNETAMSLDGADPWRARVHAALRHPQQSGDEFRDLRAELSRETSALGYLSLALGLRRAGETAAAVSVGELGLTRYPDSFGLAFWLGHHHENREERHSDALAYYLRAHSIRPHVRALQHRIGIMYESLGEPQRALRVFEVLCDEDPDNGHWHHHRASNLAWQNIDEAIVAHRRTIELETMRLATRRRSPIVRFNVQQRLFDAYTALARLLQTNGRPDEAVLEAQRAVAAVPTMPYAWVLLGDVERKRGKLTAAILAYERAIQLDNENAIAYANLGATLVKRAQPADIERALECYHTSAILDPTDRYTTRHLSGLLRWKGDLVAADEVLDRVLATTDIAEAPLFFADWVRYAGRSQLVIEAYEAHLATNPDDAKILYKLGNVYATNNRREDAVAVYRRSIAIHGDFADVHCNLASLLAGHHLYGEAAEHYRLGREIGMRTPNWRYRDTDWSTRADRQEVKEARFENLIAHAGEPRDAQELIDTGTSLYSRDRFEESIRFYARAFQLEPARAQSLQSYNAASSALRYAAGSGTSALSVEERAQTRRQALDWLRLALNWCIDCASRDRAKARTIVERWYADANLASIRDYDALLALPAAESRRWRELWSDVQALREQLND